MSDYNSGAPGSICLKFDWETRREPVERSKIGFKIPNWVDKILMGKIAKIVI